MDNKQEIIFDGYLIKGDENISVNVAYASRFSVYVRFPDEFDETDGLEFDNVVLKIMGKDTELHRSRFLLDSNIGGYSGRLFFLSEIYDFDALFATQELINLEKLADNLAIVIAHKQRVRDKFREFTADLAYDLKVYRYFFDELDKTIENEHEDVREVVAQTILNGLGREFLKFFDSKMEELGVQIKGFKKEEHEVHGFYFRKQLWDIILCSDFMTRTNVKPRGYAGDSEMMRMVYENDYRGDTTFAKIMHKYGLEVPAAAAVRNRRIMVPDILRKTQQSFPGLENDRFRFMTIACGPADELRHVFLSDDDFSNFHCTLLDQDSEALQEAADNITKIEKEKGHKIKVTYIQDSVRTMLRTPGLDKKWGKFHYMYSMGLYDYLTPPTAKVLTEKIYSLLEPGGTMLLANYHKQTHNRWFLPYWLDWVLYYREEEDMKDLLRDIEVEDVSITYDESGCQMFLSARKPF
ncbi:MAG: class I SAM-dependent methyltransferase [bacterium]|nr:class I SAM-dependent methyltransferase [bacterium]